MKDSEQHHANDRRLGGSSSGSIPRGSAGPLPRPDFVAVYREARPRLISRARNMSVLPHEVEDLVQEALTEAWRAWPGFQPEGHPMASAVAWVTSIFMHRHLTRYRRARHRAQIMRDHTHTITATTIGGAVQFKALQPNYLIGAGVERALDSLDADTREVVERFDLLGQDLLEVESEMGIPRGTAKSRLHRGRRRLAELLGSER